MKAKKVRRKQRNLKVNLYYFPSYTKSILSEAVETTLRSRAQGRCGNTNHRIFNKNSFSAEKISGSTEGCINIILVGDKEIKSLNSKYRKVNRITDVISFLESYCPLTGDIFISTGRSKKQAEQQGHPWKLELVYLAIHGVLHLLGYTDYVDRERKKMFAVQDRLFEKIVNIS